MANIKKTFNFRNGVQVDDDNLIVNATGLVGIGTTIPTEAFDVRGTAKVVGLVTSQEGFVGVFTAHTSSLGTVALSTSIIGAGVSIKSGIITSNAASGLVTYYGDARFLHGMPTSQWEDTNAGLGVVVSTIQVVRWVWELPVHSLLCKLVVMLMVENMVLVLVQQVILKHLVL